MINKELYKWRQNLQKLFVGTSGWSYKHWSGLFYPTHVKPDKYLEFYQTKFNCVELKSCFYHLPRNSTIKGWIDRTPDVFKFCPKLSRFITHQKRLNDAEEPLKKFFDLFRVMESRMGPVLIQLPPGLRFDRSLMNDFLQILNRQYKVYRFAVEVRNKTWITDAFFNLLTQYNTAFVMADSGKRFPYYEVETTDFVYLRFHGPEKLYASDYPDARLIAFADKIRGWLEKDKEVWVFFNNDFHGYAVNNAVKLRDIVHLPNNSQ